MKNLKIAIVLSIILMLFNTNGFSQSKMYFDYWTFGEYDINGKGYYPLELDSGSYFQIVDESPTDGMYLIYWDDAERYYYCESYKRIKTTEDELRIWGYDHNGSHVRIRMIDRETSLDVYYDYLSGETQGKSLAFRYILSPNI